MTPAWNLGFELPIAIPLANAILLGTAPGHPATLPAEHLLIQHIFLGICDGRVPRGRRPALFLLPLAGDQLLHDHTAHILCTVWTVTDSPCINSEILRSLWWGESTVRFLFELAQVLRTRLGGGAGMFADCISPSALSSCQKQSKCSWKVLS